jgi:hypothetical protein
LGITKAKASALVVNALLLDAGIAPENSNAAHNNLNINTDTNTNLANDDFYLGHNYHYGQGQGQYYSHDRDQSASISNNAANRTDDGTVPRDGVTDDPRLSRDPRLDSSPPLRLSSRSHNHSLFTNTGNILPWPVCAAPNSANLPWPQPGRVDSVARSTLPPLFQHPLLPTPSTQPWSQTSTQTQASAPIQQGPLPSLASLGGPLPPPSGHSVHEPLRGQPIRPLSELRGSSQNLYNSVSPSFYPFATPPTTINRSYMNNTNPRQPPPDISQPWHFPRMTEAPRGSDDYFLSALAQNFTSPSLPPLSGPSSPTSLSLSNQSWAATVGQDMPSAAYRQTTNRGGGAIDLTKEEANLQNTHSGVDPSIPFATMPATTRTRNAPGGADSSNRKRRSSAEVLRPSRPSKTRRKEAVANSKSPSSLFDDDDDDDDLPGLPEDDELETIDLSNATEVPPELMAPKVDNRVKIGKFQCVICMDDAAALTVTHCGHLFCSECLHSSLHIDSMKRTCPVCRSKIDLRDKKGKAIKSFHHLELKVMTATKKGKRPAGR